MGAATKKKRKGYKMKKEDVIKIVSILEELAAKCEDENEKKQLYYLAGELHRNHLKKENLEGKY